MAAGRLARIPTCALLLLILAASIALLALKLLNPSRVYVVIEGGSVKLHEIQLFTHYDLLAAFSAGLVAGVAAAYPLEAVRPGALAALELSDLERKVLEALASSGGRMYQWDLARRLGVAKSTLSVTLRRLQARGLVERRRVGLANLVILKATSGK